MTKLEKLTQQEQDFIYEVSRKFITGSTMDEIAQRVGICRRTAFNWSKKFKELIQEQKVQEFETIEDKVLSVSNELLGSSKLGDRLKGAELYFKTAEILQKRADSKPKASKEINTEDVLKELGL